MKQIIQKDSRIDTHHLDGSLHQRQDLVLGHGPTHGEQHRLEAPVLRRVGGTEQPPRAAHTHTHTGQLKIHSNPVNLTHYIETYN